MICQRHKSRQSGFTLIEVMAALLLLSVGLLACSGLIVLGMSGNTRSKNDSGATLAAQMVLEHLNSISANAVDPTTNKPVVVNVTDCVGNAWTISTVAGAQAGNGAGANAMLDQNNNFYAIDFSQDPKTIPAGYQMNYVMCGSQQARQATYDVRWNLMTVTPTTNLITVSARPIATNTNNAIIYMQPLTLRTIQGN